MAQEKQNFKAKRRICNWLGCLLVLVLLAVGLSWPTKYYLEMPGEAISVGQFVKSSRPKPNNLYLVTVSETSAPASVLQYLWSYTQKYTTRVPSSELLGGATNSQYQELQNWYMETSQQNAIYCAAKRAGLKPQLKYQGVYVMQVQKHSSFRGKLQVGDTVLGANGHQFKSTEEMMAYLQRQPLHARVKIKVLREGRARYFTGKIVKVAGTGKPGIGIQLVEHVKVATKPKLKIDAGAIGGPSAGLMFTLTSYEAFTGKKLAAGHKIAGTGTITPNGKVGIIGGVDKKVVAANRIGAEVFFAPTDTTGVKKKASNYVVAQRTARELHSKMKIVPVATFSDVLSYLEKNY
ncbi:PDZ domain-containing protein [Lactobacillus sp. ESL0785]|uniref:SepM family pheromone-processing serine protease n=1 Tax=Lactobacillus sp. ESL0785 TaxID=2983232 RepID=UPI0023F7C096|nr:SepM family pheromone-processing serine protease [Lactobacillus sp. ESL0785]WEV71549.1 PDZ domain-containing protein [Lactobacillus sp. ESL0785]